MRVCLLGAIVLASAFASACLIQSGGKTYDCMARDVRGIMTVSCDEVQKIALP